MARRRPGARDVLAGHAAAAAAEVEASLAPVAVPDAAAFFDIDNTVMRGASLFHFARGLARRHFFSSRDVLGFAWHQVTFMWGGERAGHISSATEAALSFVRGHTVEEMLRLGEEIYDEVMVGKLWPGTLALTRAHLDAGERVWLVSAAPVETATMIARRLGLTGALGTVSESKNGVYTGRLVGAPLHGPAKAEAVRALAQREGLDLGKCSAYSDSANDIPLLSLVGNPCAINPDARLRRHAKQHGWRVRDYRTGRKAALVAIPAAAGIGAAAGGTAAAVAILRRRST